MSRCFPYPPPGYVRNGASDEALIESIKLQRVRETAKTERRKEKKREKKEKKREKKEKQREKKDKGKPKPSEIGDGKEKKLNDDKSHKGEKSRVGSKEGYLQKRREEEAEQLEKSGLTEEHGQPVCSQSLCYSSDGTQNSNKRRKHSSSSNGSHNAGNIIRIRLPLQKHKEPDASASRERLCSTSERTDSLAQQKYEIAHGLIQEQCPPTSTRTNIVARERTPRLGGELLCSTSERTEICARDSAETLGSTLFENELQREESPYKSLIENWVPPALQSLQTDFDDQEWLFGTRQQNREGAKRFKAGNNISSSGSPTLWPCAYYLPGADIYALPFTIPF